MARQLGEDPVVFVHLCMEDGKLSPVLAYIWMDHCSYPYRSHIIKVRVFLSQRIKLHHNGSSLFPGCIFCIHLKRLAFSAVEKNELG